MTRSSISLFLLAAFFLAACSSEPISRPSVVDIGAGLKPEAPHGVPVPPWQTWSEQDAPEPLKEAAHLAAQGQIEKAESAYFALEKGAVAPEVRFEAFVRRMGTLLQQGKSKEVLSQVSQFAAESKRQVGDLSPRLTLLVAFAYEHQHDIDQTFAWLSLTRRKAGGDKNVSQRARSEAERLIRKIKGDAFEKYGARWTGDPFINGLFSAERARRARGGHEEGNGSPDWFSRATYAGGVASAEPAGSIAPQLLEEGKIALGVLLPLSGQFAAHAERVRNGIELALETHALGSRAQLFVRDTGGDAMTARREYETLVSETHVAAVLGPLLVKDTEAVAERSAELRVPFVTFAKKSGITALSPFAFRLGATAENQIEEAVTFARSDRNIRTFASVSSGAAAAREFLTSFHEIVVRGGGEVTDALTFRFDDASSIEAVVQRIEQTKPGAVVFADALNAALPVIQALRQSAAAKDTLILGSASWDDAAILRGYGPVLDKTVLVTPFFSRSRRPEVVEFSAAYEAKYGARPDILSAQSYDAANILLNALESADLKSEGIADQLRKLEPVPGVTGQLRVTPSGDIVRRMSVVEVRQGDAVEIFVGGVPTGEISADERAKESEPAAGTD